MIYSLQCTYSNGIRVNSLNISLANGQSFDCPKQTYDTNKEIQALVSSGMLKLKVKEHKSGLRANSNKRVLRSNPTSERVVEKVVERVVQSPIDMDAITRNVVEQIGAVLSPEILAQAIAAQLPTVQVPNAQVASKTSNNSFMSSDEDNLMFIPSTIVDKNTVASKSSASESISEDSDGLADAMAALKAMKKKKGQT
jgi:hypothetical protein